MSRRVVLAVYRCLLRNARLLDRSAHLKPLISRDATSNPEACPLDRALRLFLGSDSLYRPQDPPRSAASAVRQAFRSQTQREQSLDAGLSALRLLQAKLNHGKALKLQSVRPPTHRLEPLATPRRGCLLLSHPQLGAPSDFFARRVILLTHAGDETSGAVGLVLNSSALSRRRVVATDASERPPFSWSLEGPLLRLRVPAETDPSEVAAVTELARALARALLASLLRSAAAEPGRQEWAEPRWAPGGESHASDSYSDSDSDSDSDDDTRSAAWAWKLAAAAVSETDTAACSAHAPHSVIALIAALRTLPPPRGAALSRSMLRRRRRPRWARLNGGPLPGAALLHCQPHLGGAEVLPGLFVAAACEDEPQDGDLGAALRALSGPGEGRRRCALLLGRSEWAVGQLGEELARGEWVVAQAPPEWVMRAARAGARRRRREADGDAEWRGGMAALGGEWAGWAGLPRALP